MPANEEIVRNITRIAGADFTSPNNGLYRFVKINPLAATAADGSPIAPGNVILCNSSGERAFGVLRGRQIAGHGIPVAVGGRVLVVAGASIAAGALVQSDANGAAITQASTGCVCGTALEGAAAGDVLSVELDLQGAP